ncbi:MAG TPA: DUF1614 domain-containing protein, partial [Acidimicrobiales bacterium]|nr:DUF1614 domain-containing protein [Acidimicrobiales bacterium]
AGEGQAENGQGDAFEYVSSRTCGQLCHCSDHPVIVDLVDRAEVPWSSGLVSRMLRLVVPTFIPPIAAALAAWVFALHVVAALAYVAGTIGTLVGGDVSNLRNVRELDAPVLPIGGAGTFDGIFVTGILAVLLAAL